MLSEPVRAWVYRVGLAVVLIAIAYGIIEDEAEVAGWVALVTAITGNGLASIHTSTAAPADTP